MAGGRMYTPRPTPLDPPLAIRYRNHEKSLAYFSHLASLILFFFTKRQIQKGGGGAWPNVLTPQIRSWWRQKTSKAINKTLNNVANF